MTINWRHQTLQYNFSVTIVYAKYSTVQRLDLWNDIFQVANKIDGPCMIGGDFNVVLIPKEKIGGLSVSDADHEDFDYCISACELNEVPFKGIPLTRWNGRADNECIFERLDRILIN